MNINQIVSGTLVASAFGLIVSAAVAHHSPTMFDETRKLTASGGSSST